MDPVGNAPDFRDQSPRVNKSFDQIHDDGSTTRIRTVESSWLRGESTWGELGSGGRNDPERVRFRRSSATPPTRGSIKRECQLAPAACVGLLPPNKRELTRKSASRNGYRGKPHVSEVHRIFFCLGRGMSTEGMGAR